MLDGETLFYDTLSAWNLDPTIVTTVRQVDAFLCETEGFCRRFERLGGQQRAQLVVEFFDKFGRPIGAEKQLGGKGVRINPRSRVSSEKNSAEIRFELSHLKHVPLARVKELLGEMQAIGLRLHEIDGYQNDEIYRRGDPHALIRDCDVAMLTEAIRKWRKVCMAYFDH